MREIVKEFTEIVAQTLPVPEPVFEFGALQVPGQEGYADLRYIFPGMEYVGCDIQEGVGVDRVLDLHSIDLPPETAGTVLMMDTIEHVERFWDALKEVHRILKPNGVFAMSSLMDFPIHRFPSDYWRFTPFGFECLLKEYPFSFVEFVGEELFPHTVVGVSCKGTIPEERLDEFKERMAKWKASWNSIHPPRAPMVNLVKQFIPPIALHVYRRLKDRD